MGSAAKSVSKAVSSATSSIKLPEIKAPSITMDPTKLVSNAAEAATNIQKDVFIKPVVDVASTAIGGVGQVMSQPGAGAVLGAAGTAFGVPGLGMLAQGFGGTMSPSPAPVVQPSSAPLILPSSSSDNSNTLLIVGGMGGLMLILVLFLTMRGKR